MRDETVTTTTSETTALVPIAEALPELRDEVYADVCAWDAARLELRDGYDVADGVYLAKIRDKLMEGDRAGSGMWTRYLAARKLSLRTADARIAKAEGHPYDKPSLLRSNSGRQLEETAAAWRAAQAEAEAARERAAKLEEQYQQVNNELANAHRLIKRGKLGTTATGAAHLDEMEQLWKRNQTARAQYEQEQQARREAWQRRQEREAKRRQPLTPAQEKRRAQREAARAAEEAEQARQEAVKRREWRVQWMEGNVRSLAKDAADDAWYSLLTDEQRQRFAALLPKLREVVGAIAKRLGESD